MEAIFIQDCSKKSPLLDYYAEREYEWRAAGRKIKKAIADTDFVGYFPFTLSNLNSRYFTVQRLMYEKELYAVVTNSAVDYIFKIT